MIYKFPVKVTSVFERKLSKHERGAGKEAIFSTASAGWYIGLEGLASIHVGAEKPEFEPGETIYLKLERSPNARPRE